MIFSLSILKLLVGYWHENVMRLWDCLEKFGQSILKKNGYIKLRPSVSKNIL
jgi:hypothetical protein